MPLIRKDAGSPKPTSVAVDACLQLASASSDARWDAARQLAKEPSSVGALERALSSETDPRVREALFTSLAHIRTPDAVMAVLPHIRSDDAAIRANALDALTSMADAVESSLPALLADPDVDAVARCRYANRGACDGHRRASRRIGCCASSRLAATRICAGSVYARAQVCGVSVSYSTRGQQWR